jgi:hypothetical protein
VLAGIRDPDYGGCAEDDDEYRRRHHPSRRSEFLQ